jgi:hypothetical protein
VPRTDVVVPYTLSSPDLCSAAGLVDTILDPAGSIGTALRANFATALGLEPNSAFIYALWVCDGTYIPLQKDAAINQVDVSGFVAGRRLRSFGSYNGPMTALVMRRLAATTSSLNITLDGQTVVVELGVSIPTAIAPQMSAFLAATLGGGTAAEIASAAAALDAAIRDLANDAPSSVPGSSLQNVLGDIISNLGSQSSTQTFFRQLTNVTFYILEPLADALGLPAGSAANIQQGTYAAGIRTIESENDPVSPADDGSGLSTGSIIGLAVGLSLLALCCCCCCLFLLCRRRKRKEKKEKDEAAAAKNIDFSQVNPMTAAPPVAVPPATATVPVAAPVPAPEPDHKGRANFRALPQILST